MQLRTRKLLDRSFSSLGLVSIVVMAFSLVVILAPIIWKGLGAFVFRGTIEHRKVMSDLWFRGNPEELGKDIALADDARQPVLDMLAAYENGMREMSGRERREAKENLRDLKKLLRHLIGPLPGEDEPVLLRQRYGQTRWDRAKVKLHDLMMVEEWDYSDMSGMGIKVYKPRVEQFRGTALEDLFPYVESHVEEMLRPRWTFYWRFLTDDSRDAHIFGGIWPEMLGTIYLTLGAMIFAIPMGVIAAIYLCEYASPGRIISFIRICISTLAGVPSIVFGLFGLAFFLNTVGVSSSKSVLAGSLTLALLILPTVIRASEEAILSVPQAYKEAALALGAGRWRTIMTVILPAALPGILTGVVISMGRAAGETAPIIFTAAVSVGRALNPWQALSQPTPALPWNIYNLCSEHEAVDEIRHVQFGMVFTLVAVVLLLNLTAILLRARISRKLKG